MTHYTVHVCVLCNCVTLTPNGELVMTIVSNATMNCRWSGCESARNASNKFNCSAGTKVIMDARDTHNMGQACLTHETTQQVIPYLAREIPVTT